VTKGVKKFSKDVVRAHYFELTIQKQTPLIIKIMLDAGRDISILYFVKSGALLKNFLSILSGHSKM
jgi:hypothetical protein